MRSTTPPQGGTYLQTTRCAPKGPLIRAGVFAALPTAGDQPTALRVKLLLVGNERETLGREIHGPHLHRNILQSEKGTENGSFS